MNACPYARLRVLFLCALFLGFGLVEVRAQAPDGPIVAEVTAVSEQHLAAQRGHLVRVLVWGGVNVALGASLLAASDREEQRGRFGFGVQSAAWGAINTGIAVVGLLTAGDATASTVSGALRAENLYADILLFNLGLNVAYASVGATLLAVSGRGVAHPAAWRGHGAALIVQGAGLFVLDGIAYLGTRTRTDALIDLSERVALNASPLGAALSITW